MIEAVRLTFCAVLLGTGLTYAAETTAPIQRPTRPGGANNAVVVSPAGAAGIGAGGRPVKGLSLKMVRVGGVEYTPSAEWGANFGLKQEWDASAKTLVLRNQSVRLEFELDSRFCLISGLRMVLGEAPRLYKGAPHLSRIDAERLLGPILRPGLGQTRAPRLKTIVLDPGHGGKDTGKVNEKLRAREKEYSLDTAVRVRKLLEREGYRVVLTRSGDQFVELQERAAIAERANADLFISIHFNSVENGVGKVTGVETYTMTPQHQLSSDRVPDQYVALANPGNLSDHWNSILGYQMHRQVLHELKSSDRGLKRGRLAVLRLAPCPAVLVEGGYLSHDGEARKIMTTAYRQNLAEGIVNGVRSYAIAVEGFRRLQGR